MGPLLHHLGINFYYNLQSNLNHAAAALYHLKARGWGKMVKYSLAVFLHVYLKKNFVSRTHFLLGSNFTCVSLNRQTDVLNS